MKIIVSTILLFLLSSNLFASDTCLTNGDCQAKYPTTFGINTYIVKTGTDALGETSCALRAYYIELGHYCEKEEGKVFGTCVKEEEIQVTFDPNDPSRCQDAIEL